MLLIEKPDEVIRKRSTIFISWGDYDIGVLPGKGKGKGKEEPHVWLHNKDTLVWSVGATPPRPWETFRERFKTFLKVFGAIVVAMGPLIWGLLYLGTQSLFASGFGLVSVVVAGIGFGLHFSNFPQT